LFVVNCIRQFEPGANLNGGSAREMHAETWRTSELSIALPWNGHVLSPLGNQSLFRMEDENERRRVFTCVTGGGGFSGVEITGALNDFVRDALQH